MSMLKVLVVDDEPRIRRGLGALIPQLDPDWMVSGEAKNGLEALEWVKQELPDLVITDIRMPYMNGLDLLSTLREYPVQVVILSGYGYFEYAKTAIKFGAYDFLLKPVKPHEIQDVLARLKADKQSKLLQFQPSNINPNYSKVWREWLTDHEELAYYSTRLQEQLPVDVSSYRMLAIEIDSFDDLISEKKWGDRQLVYFAVRNIVQEILIGHNQMRSVFLFNSSSRMIYLLLNVDPDRALLEKMISEVKSWVRISISTALSDRTEHFKDLPALYEHAQEAIQRKWIFGEGTVHFYEEELEEGLKLLGYPSDLDEQVIQAIRLLNREHAMEKLNQFLEKISTPYVPVRLFRQFSLQLLSSVLRFVHMSNLTEMVFEELPATPDLFNREFSVEAYKTYMDQLISTCARVLERNTSNKRNRLLDKAMAYIHKNYHLDLSLDDVAGSIRMGSSYFSTYFKQETGSTFIEYLTALRLEKAKQLMSNADLKLYEIAVQVGYQDVKYFSRVFKKVTGVPPVEYRQFFYREDES